MILSLPAPAVLGALAAIFGVLVVASLVVGILAWRRPGVHDELVRRVQSWWIIVVLFSLALVVSERSALVLFAFISFIAFKEYLSLIPTRRADRRVLFWAYLAIPVQYLWIDMEWYGMFIIFVPVYMFLLLPLRMVLQGVTTNFLSAAGTLHWGLMITVFSLGHAAYLLALPAAVNAPTGGQGLLLFLVIATQANDVFQYLWGRSLGTLRVLPSISPNKTWVGLIGGVVTTMALALVMGPWLTPFSLIDTALAGLIIGAGGFCGDVTISAIKRDLGVKDAGSMLPGHGGMLDRVDSLTFTAPLFFHFTYYLYY